MEYREFAPPPPLAPYVRCLWTLTASATPPPAAVEPILPDGCAELVGHWGDPFLRVRVPAQARQPRAFFVGATAAPFTVVPSGRLGVAGARFLPGGAVPWLTGIAAGSLEGIELPVAGLHPAGADPARGGGRGDVDALARHVGLSARQLQRLFEREVGLRPKTLLRIARFQSFLGAAAARPGAKGAELAAAAGYADQAHLIRDFQAFAASSPQAWLARHSPFAGALAGFEA